MEMDQSILPLNYQVVFLNYIRSLQMTSPQPVRG